MKYLALLSAAILSGCDSSQSESMTTVEGDRIYTAEHDGHKFVVYDGNSSGAMIHHPSCPCQLKPEKP